MVKRNKDIWNDMIRREGHGPEGVIPKIKKNDGQLDQ